MLAQLRTCENRNLERFFPGDSELASRMRALNWSETDFGPPEQWPENLRVALSFCLSCHSPAFLCWGRKRNILYNDACLPLLPELKSPRALAGPASECCPEIWNAIGRMVQAVFATGQAPYPEDVELYVARTLPREEVYFTNTCTPILAADGQTVDGVFSSFTERTRQILDATRLDTLRKLGRRPLENLTVEAACRQAASILSENPRDIPFAAIYLVDAAGSQAALAASIIPNAEDLFPRFISLNVDESLCPWPLKSVLRTRQAVEIEDLRSLGLRVHARPWPEPVTRAAVLPIFAASGRLAAVLLAGVGSRRPWDAGYRTFFELVAGSLTNAVSIAQGNEGPRTGAHADPASRGNGSVEYLVGLVQDIIDRKRTQEKVLAGEQRFRRLVESIPHHVWSFRKDGTVGYWNQRFADYTGLTVEQLKHGGWEALHPDDVARVREAWRKSWAKGAPYEQEQRIRGRDGRYRSFICRAVPVPDAHGRFLEWFGTSTDVEDRRQAQEQLHNAQSQLARVTHLTTMGELAAAIAHEVNQPLGAIVNNANVSLRLAGAETAQAREELVRALSDVVNDANRASAIIARMRGLMKQAAPSSESLRLYDLIQEVLAFAERDLVERLITVRVELSQGLPRISGDRVQLQQMLLNLVLNGAEAMSAVPPPRRILTIGGWLSQRNGRLAALIVVHDFGCGFGVEDPERLFESLYTTKTNGLGMGLHISRSIAEAHDGHLWAHANEEGGATFFVSLPVANP
jgi:PAS domain S-box-containing protein